MSSVSRVQRHFDRDAERFDAIYETRKPLYQRAVDRLRRVVVERFHLVCALAPLQGRWSVLDVGCGSGRYGLALARSGAARAVGLDFSAAMIDLARREASAAGLGERCVFTQCEFMAYAERETFDVVLAMGYFDYLRDPLPHLSKMAALCACRLFVSFPKRWEWRVPARKMRFLLQRGYVRFYGKDEIRRLVAAAGLRAEDYSLIDLGRDWILVAHTGRPEAPTTSG